MSLLPVLLLSLSFDGAAAHRHAATLAALGPRPLGSPRSQVAAEFVAARLRDTGLDEVAVRPFRVEGARGFNVVGVLRGRRPGVVALIAHHDGASGSPAAYRATSVALLIETARALVLGPARVGTLEFASLDGGAGGAPSAGVRAYLETRASHAGALTAALVIDGGGWKRGMPTLQLYPTPDRLRPGLYRTTPEGLAREVMRGAAERGQRLVVGDPLLAWPFQPAVRAFRMEPTGDDGAFLLRGVPAARLGDSTRSAAYPWRGTAADDADKLDEASLSELGEAILGAVARLAAHSGRIEMQPTWFAAWGQVIGKRVIVGFALVAALIGLVASLGEPLRVLARVAQAGLLAILLWRHPLLTTWLLALPSLTSLACGPLAILVGLLPLGAVVAVGTLGSSAAGGVQIVGLWLRPWEIVAFAMALVLLFVRSPVRRLKKRPRR